MGAVRNELLELRDGKSAKEASVTVDTDHAGICLASTFTVYVNGSDVSTLAQAGALFKIFTQDFDQGFGVGPLPGRAALHPTKDPKVWYQLHGSLDKDFAEGHEYIKGHVQKWSADELEMHSYLLLPEGCRNTEMGKRLAEHSLINYTHESYAKETPPVPLRRLLDRRPLAGIKVLGMVRIIAGPTVGTILSSFGADVIRIGPLELALNAGKRTIDLDIGKQEDKARLLELVGEADIFVQGFRYGSLDRKGLGLKVTLGVAAKRIKDLVYVAETCYGPSGPFAGFTFVRSSPAQFVTEIMREVINGWKNVFPEYISPDSPFMMRL
ncbi:hypothetical protein N7522_008076 [Penicillium canescens]|uniref:Uncharacterized protein n=1 Tax=Penicillium canescens TaxID=5083 RepID=A0AAD6IF36_PENCN|nr:uncharacterized protein N7446_002958 [Penicillium canescens]KAJ5996416.1 hypothetical protein N7522_008076 [Penicillium canescens]KAJ6044764.1 hypothetical protein N7460_006119 [Penicillium canescens]KAJ6075181.1 hypothetical protein N7446_002958 [Penicillium canescens]